MAQEQLRLFAAIEAGDTQLVNALLAAGADVAQARTNGWTALMTASLRGRLECVRALVAAGANVAQADEHRLTALMVASQQGHLVCVRALLEAGADVAQVAETGVTALLAASSQGHLECVRALLEAGADVAHASETGVTSLIAASREGNRDCVYALLDAGSDVAHAAHSGWTALMTASLQGHLECVRALLEAGADVAQAAASGSTALMAASLQGHFECVRALLEAGADVMQLRDNGTCALAGAGRFLGTLQLLCAYAPSREAVRAHPMSITGVPAECVHWLDATRRWTSPLHHFEFLPIERVRALLVEGADVRAGDAGPDAPTPVGLAGDRPADGRAALIIAAAAPWSPRTHALFPAAAKARAVELLRIGWLLARRLQSCVADASQVEVALRDVWLAYVMPHAIERSLLV